MLYTTYFAKIDKIPQGAVKLIIMRYPPKDLNVLKYNKLHIVPGLAPSAELLKWYNGTKKEYSDWVSYTEKFELEMQQRQDMKDALDKVARLVKGGVDVYLICYEKNYAMCHRTLLASHLVENHKIKWTEL